MQDIIAWIINNYKSICTIVVGVIFVASLIVKLTPTPKDNNLLKGIIGAIEKISIFNTKENAKYIEDAKKNLEEEEKKA